MTIHSPAKRLVWLFLTGCLVVAPLHAQRRTIPKKAETPATTQANVTFDTLLAAESYKVYGEVRGVGQLIRSDGVNDLVDPIMKIAGPPKEFKSLVRWLKTRSDSLLTSRLMFAAMPARPKLPQVLVAIEFPSAEEAQKFKPQLNEFLPKLLPPATPTPTPAPAGNPPKAKSGSGESEGAPAKPAAPAYVLQQAGSLVFVTDVPFSLKDLRPAGSKLLGEDQNFRTIHDRFTSESVFLYVDTAAIEKEELEQRKKYEEEERKRIETEAANPPKPDTTEDPPDEGEMPQGESAEQQPTPVVVNDTTLEGVTSEPPAAQPTPEPPSPASMALETLTRALFGGLGSRPTWPQAIGAAAVVDGDSYVVRVLLVNDPEVKGGAIPFFPQFISGPALVPESPSILPSDTELFVTASLDFPQIYDNIVKAMNDSYELAQRYQPQRVNLEKPELPFESLEKQLGIKLKTDLLPLLGNEVVFTMPMKALAAGPPRSSPSPQASEGPGGVEKPKEPEGPNPIFAIAVKDREAVKALIPKIVESMGFKGASLIAQTEKRDDTELISYANVVAYAFIGNFLVLSTDVKTTRHVVDSYLNHDTLGSSSQFRNSTRWQPRELLGQIYVSPALMESYNAFARDAEVQLGEQLRSYLMQLSPLAEPVTYSLSNEGLGPLHELHIPKSLVMMMVAGMSASANEPPLQRNEMATRSALHSIASAEQTFRLDEARYATLDELVSKNLIPKDLIQSFGYKIELTTLNTHFEVSAVPTEYGKTGRLSFYIDETGVLREGDHAGGPANIADKAAP